MFQVSWEGHSKQRKQLEQILSITKYTRSREYHPAGCGQTTRFKIKTWKMEQGTDTGLRLQRHLLCKCLQFTKQWRENSDLFCFLSNTVRYIFWKDKWYQYIKWTEGTRGRENSQEATETAQVGSDTGLHSSTSAEKETILLFRGMNKNHG